MKIYVPDYYKDFQCKADRCEHTCCVGWEIDIDSDSLSRFRSMPEISPYIEEGETPHFRLDAGDRCPFLRQDGLCEMIVRHGEDILCQICADHPRFRNYWSDRVEIGLGLVCEEAARIILSREKPMALVLLEDDRRDGSAVVNTPCVSKADTDSASDGNETDPDPFEAPETGSPEDTPEGMTEEERWLWDLRRELWDGIEETGPEARLKEYLIFRHLPDALYDGLLEERISFIRSSWEEITSAWRKTDGSLNALVEVVIRWSYDHEYDDDLQFGQEES